MRRTLVWLTLGLLLSVGMAAGGVKEALAFLEKEVPAWQPANQCYSCHNNGDGARALLLAGLRAGPPIDSTLAFLQKPEGWTEDPTPLSILQFSRALQAAGQGGKSWQTALQMLAKAQAADGHWETESTEYVGSPATYGAIFGTALARDLLAEWNSPQQEAARAKAAQWLQAQKAEHPLHQAALVWAFGQKAEWQRLLRMQGADGSWNGGEAFDTAVAMLALGGVQATLPTAKGGAPSAQQKQLEEALGRARKWLLANQLPNGAWRATTRPKGQESYAQQVSTTAWAVTALLPAKYTAEQVPGMAEAPESGPAKAVLRPKNPAEKSKNGAERVAPKRP